MEGSKTIKKVFLIPIISIIFFLSFLGNDIHANNSQNLCGNDNKITIEVPAHMYKPETIYINIHGTGKITYVNTHYFNTRFGVNTYDSRIANLTLTYMNYPINFHYVTTIVLGCEPGTVVTRVELNNETVQVVPTITGIEIEPRNIQLQKNESIHLTVIAHYSDGTSSDITNEVTWSFSNPNVVIIATNGIVTALNGGMTNITATYQGITATATLTVEEPPSPEEPEPPPDPPKVAERLEVFPKNATFKKNETKEFKATIYYSDGSSRDVTNEAIWTVSNSDIARVENGTVTALDEGETTITATFQLEQNVTYMSGAYFNNIINQSYAQSPTFFVQNTSLSDSATIKVKVPLIDKLKKFIDNIFRPVHAFLDLAIEQLRKASTVTAQGLNVGQYLRIFGDLPGPWQLVVYSLMISMGLIGGIFIFRSIMRIYYALKEGVKWW